MLHEDSVIYPHWLGNIREEMLEFGIFKLVEDEFHYSAAQINTNSSGDSMLVSRISSNETVLAEK